MGSFLKILDQNGVQGVESDLLDHHSLHEAAEGVDTVYSMASPMPYGDDEFERVNTEGISNLLEVSQEMGVKTIVHLSTIDVYGFGARTIEETSVPHPTNPYQEAKAAAEQALLSFARVHQSPRVVIVRAARAVGSRDETLTVPLLRMLSSGKVVVPEGLEMSFTHPKDIAQAMYKSATNPNLAGGVYLVKSFDARPLQLAEALAVSTGIRADIRRAGVFAKTPLPRYTVQQLEASLRIGPQASWASFGYEPEFTLEKTCQEIAAWYKREPWVSEPA